MVTGIIASPCVYADSIEHGKTGLIARSNEDWEEYLQRLVSSKEACLELGWNARRHVQNKRMLGRHIQKQIDWYKALCRN